MTNDSFLYFTGFHNGSCFHDFNLVRIITRVGPNAALVLGSDDKFHVVNLKCLPIEYRFEFQVGFEPFKK